MKRLIYLKKGKPSCFAPKERSALKKVVPDISRPLKKVVPDISRPLKKVVPDISRPKKMSFAMELTG